MVWQPGTRLNQYKIDRVLGSGGFGITYKANHVSLKQRVVIKTINDTLHRDPEYNSYVDRFRKEAQILAKLGEIRHPHIVRVSDLFEAPMQERSWWQALWGVTVPQLPCLVMDFIDGKNLFEWVQENRSPLGEQEALKYIQQAGEALHLVHRAEIGRAHV
jgi:serine/threonine-protein kinase